MPGIQLPIGIDTVNPVDADFKRGPWASIPAALAGINIALRYNNLSFYVVGDPNEYYWLDTDLTDSGLLIRSTGGASFPIVRYVYAVQDPSDVTLMGGASNNVYNTPQAAYDAANALQIALGGTNIVFLVIYGIHGTGITLTADFNFRVRIIGNSPTDSQIGAITLSNASGNGYNFGNISSVYISSITVGNIVTTPTGATGNGGSINIELNYARVGQLRTAPSNASNLTGNSGNITINSVSSSTSLVGAIMNGIQQSASTGITGSITATAFGRLRVGIIRAVSFVEYGGSDGGGLSLKNVDCTSIKRYTHQSISIVNCSCTNGGIEITNLNLLSNISINIIKTNIEIGGIGIISDPLGTTPFVNISNVEANSIYLEGVSQAVLSYVKANAEFFNYALTIFDCGLIIIDHSVFDTSQYSDGTITAYAEAASLTENTLLLTLINTLCIYRAPSLQSIIAGAPLNIFTSGTYYENSVDPQITLIASPLDT